MNINTTSAMTIAITYTLSTNNLAVINNYGFYNLNKLFLSTKEVESN